MLDVASRLADSKAGDIRIEAAIAKLYGSEMGWKVLDELIQVRGGRGYETAASLKARGEKPVPAEQALDWGLINRVVADESLGEETAALAARLASGPTLSYAAGKRQVNSWLFSRMDEQLELEARNQQEMAESDDFVEGVMAFMEKRPTRFTGR